MFLRAATRPASRACPQVSCHAARSPWQNPYVDRLIGTLRRECLDHVLIFGERHLRRVLTLYALYYNETRTHLGLAKDARYDALSNDAETSSQRLFCPDCIIATPGYDFREGQPGQGHLRSQANIVARFDAKQRSKPAATV